MNKGSAARQSLSRLQTKGVKRTQVVILINAS